ncbi:MAG TPA: hypothetical protein VFP84_18835, partial [Kofleriaceae bacterium]|nr:hypothetical protein [Kofleriaceae bacterium]
MTSSSLVLTGCASSQRAWPARSVAVGDRDLAARGDITTIDVLPLDLQLWEADGGAVDLDAVREHAESSIMTVALQTLAQRNYAVNNLISWDGEVQDGSVAALTRRDLQATMQALGRYGASADHFPGQLPVPFLPARLGVTTGSDATLYIGGWGFVGEPEEHSSTGAKVAEGIGIALIAVAAIALIVLVVAGGKGGGQGGGGHGGGGHGGGGH